MEKRNREIVCGSISFFICTIVYMCCLSIPDLSAWISSHGNINMLVYGMTLILFCVIFAAGMFLFSLGKGAKLEWLEKPAVKLFFLILMLAGQILFYIAMIEGEPRHFGSVAYKYAWHTQPMVLVILLFFLEFAGFIWLYSRWMDQGRESSWLVWAVFAALTLLIWRCMDTPNIFGRGEWGDYYHAHAYFNSIYNVYWGMPYTAEITSIYGHYGLLWKLPMELVGGDFRKFVWILAFLGAFAHFCCFLCLKWTVKSRLLQILGALAASVPILGLRGGYYWQVWPHRILFPIIMLLFCTGMAKCGRLGSWKTAAAGYGICILAVVWNTETGMILAVAWAGMYLSRCLCERSCGWKTVAANLIVHGAGVGCSLFGAYGLVNLYNRLKHSPANTLKEFLIPLLSDSYMTDVLHVDLERSPSAYMPELLLLLMGTAVGISGWRWFHRRGQKAVWQHDVIFFLSVSALGRLVYYMNRPAFYNLDCCHFSAVILLAYLGPYGLRFLRKKDWRGILQKSFDQTVRTVLGVTSVLVLLALSSGLLLQFGENSYIKENYHNEEELDNFAQAVAAQIPAHTFGFGMNVAELYSWLHWSTQYFGIDFSDMYVAPQGAQRVVDTIREQDVPGFLTTQASMPILQRFNPEGYEWLEETYTLEKTFPIHDEEYLYYVKTEE